MIVGQLEALFGHMNPPNACQDIVMSQAVDAVIHSLLAGTSASKLSGRRQNDPVQALMRHFEEHFAEKLIIEEISHSLFINAAHLTRLFKVRTGFSPYDYLKRYRIMKARELLQYTDISIKDIAVSVGFAQTSNFISQFKSLEQMTPACYRRCTI